MPLLRRIPKRGFNNSAFRPEFAEVNVEQLNGFADGAEVTTAALFEQGILKRRQDGLKLLGNGELKRKLTVKAQRFSASAREKITQAGGTCVELPMPGIHHQDTPVTKEKPAQPGK